jgi:hypothetical protein
LGDKKVKRLYQTLHEPFRSTKQKIHTNGGSSRSGDTNIAGSSSSSSTYVRADSSSSSKRNIGGDISSSNMGTTGMGTNGFGATGMGVSTGDGAINLEINSASSEVNNDLLLIHTYTNLSS